jgi:hypothetical protein
LISGGLLGRRDEEEEVEQEEVESEELASATKCLRKSSS